MTTLSPAAQAVMDAVEDDCIHPDDKHRIAAAALRAAADQVAPRTPEPAGSIPTNAWHRWNARGVLRLNLLAIAAELEANAQ